MTRAASSSSSTSLSNKPTTVPSEKGEKYSVKGTNKQQEDKAYKYAHLGACYLELEYLDEYSSSEASWY